MTRCQPSWIARLLQFDRHGDTFTAGRPRRVSPRDLRTRQDAAEQALRGNQQADRLSDCLLTGHIEKVDTDPRVVGRFARPNGTTARRHQPAWMAATSKCETVVSRSTRYSSSSG